MSARVNCKVCEFLATLSDEELLQAAPCIGLVVEARWPGATCTLDGDTATPEDIAAAQAKVLKALPAHLHKYLGGGSIQ